MPDSISTEELRGLVAKANEPCPKPLPDTATCRVEEAHLAVLDTRNRADWECRVGQARAELAARSGDLLAELDALRAALKPFARMADLIEPFGMEDDEWCGEEESVTLQVKDYRAARAALNPKQIGEA